MIFIILKLLLVKIKLSDTIELTRGNRSKDGLTNINKVLITDTFGKDGYFFTLVTLSTLLNTISINKRYNNSMRIAYFEKGYKPPIAQNILLLWRITIF